MSYPEIELDISGLSQNLPQLSLDKEQIKYLIDACQQVEDNCRKRCLMDTLRLVRSIKQRMQSTLCNIEREERENEGA